MSSRAVGSGIANVPHMMAYYDAFEQTLASIDISVVLVQLVDFAPAEALPFLAQQFAVLGLRGYQFCTTDIQRRGLLKAAISLKRLCGTPAGVEQAIIAVGFANALVTERTGIFYNGVYTHNGTKRHGGAKWYNFNVEVFYHGATPSNAQQALINSLIGVYKNTRDVLLTLKFTAII
jgi:P2-related tail formation protein